jgi:hypothetical protein
MMDGLIKGMVGIIGVALIGAVASSLKMISEEEKQYLPSFNRGFRRVVLWFLFTTLILIYFLLMFSVTIVGKSSLVTKVVIFLFLNRYSPWITILLFSSFLITVCWQRYKLFIRSLLQKDREKGKYRVVYGLLFVSFLFAFFMTGYSVFFIQMILAGINEDFSLGLHETREVIFYLYTLNKPIYHFIIFFVCVGYSLLMLLMRAVYRTIYFEKISINIYLKNGLVLEDKYIINHNLDNSILIADSFKKTDRNKRLIPKANIDSILFNRVDYSFGEKRVKSKLEYKEDEMKNEFDDLVKQWRKDQIDKHSNF